MIQMHSEDNIAKHRSEVKKRLMDSYHVQNEQLTTQVKDLLSKAISIEAFREKYTEEEYESYSPAAVEKFKADFSEEVTKGGEEENETLSKALAGLEPVVVTRDTDVALFYVRKKATQE